MFVAAWSFDMNYGTRQECFGLLKEFGAKIEKVPGWKGKNTRALWGSIGAPESRVVLQHEFASLADIEASWTALQNDQSLFKQVVSQFKTVIVPASPKWEVYRVIDR